jgi:3-oxoacyl-[acyl-carrier protein] reductase
MDMGISGRKAIVCASSRGLGRACAEALAAEGVELVINGLDAERLKGTADEIASNYGVSVTPVAANVSTAEGQDALLAACPAPDILVNNNGGPPLKDFRALERDAIIEGVIQNMVTPIELIQRVVGHMVDQKFGRIVNITSASVKMPILGLDLSSGARAGLTAFMAGPARDIARHNVTVNGLLPGMFDTDRLKGSIDRMADLQGISAEEAGDKRRSSIPAARFGNPDEFGHACAFLCSAHAGYITGQNILLDGGLFNSSV